MLKLRMKLIKETMTRVEEIVCWSDFIYPASGLVTTSLFNRKCENSCKMENSAFYETMKRTYRPANIGHPLRSGFTRVLVDVSTFIATFS